MMPLEIKEERKLSEGKTELVLRYCRTHKSHRAFQGDLAGLDWVEVMELS